MRQLLIEVPRGHGDRVLAIATEHDGTNLAAIEAKGAQGPIDLVVVHVSNQRVEGLVAALQDLPELRLTLLPTGVIALYPPADQAPEQVTDVRHRSPLEIFFSALQSVGSWKGFLGYAVASAVVAWIGMITETIYLLTASMLVAPYASPAMTAAIGTARGDATLLRRSVVRYLAALGAAIATSGLLSLVTGQTIASGQMVEISKVSQIAILLPLAAGAAGALNLVMSERNSLVSGAAVGMLVAASIAPPAALVGMAGAIGHWGMVTHACFVLVLQLVGINLAAAVVFRAFGLASKGPRYQRGKGWVTVASFAITVALLGGLLAVQFSRPPELQRQTVSHQASAAIQDEIRQSGLAHPVEVNARFTRADIEGQRTLLAVVYVQSRGRLPEDEVRKRLEKRIQARMYREFDATPLIDIRVLKRPNETRSSEVQGLRR